MWQLSISLGGYNTTVDLLATRTFGFIYPYKSDNEQGDRAKVLEKFGLVKVLDEATLVPSKLADLIAKNLNKSDQVHDINLNGLENFREFLVRPQ